MVLLGSKNLRYSVNFHIGFGAPEGFESLDDLGIEKFAVQIGRGVFNRVKTVKNLHILITNEQLFRESAFDGIQKGAR